VTIVSAVSGALPTFELVTTGESKLNERYFVPTTALTLTTILRFVPWSAAVVQVSTVCETQRVAEQAVSPSFTDADKSE
jgi:hypothetical protein